MRRARADARGTAHVAARARIFAALIFAALRCFGVAGACVLGVSGCGKLQNFGGEAPPLTTFTVRFDGDLAPLRPAGVTNERALNLAKTQDVKFYFVLTPD